MATDVEVRATTKFQNTAGRNRKDAYRMFTFPCYTYIHIHIKCCYGGGGGGGERYIVYGGGQMCISGLFLKLFFYKALFILLAEIHPSFSSGRQHSWPSRASYDTLH